VFVGFWYRSCCVAKAKPSLSVTKLKTKAGINRTARLQNLKIAITDLQNQDQCIKTLSSPKALRKLGKCLRCKTRQSPVGQKEKMSALLRQVAPNKNSVKRVLTGFATQNRDLSPS